MRRAMGHNGKPLWIGLSVLLLLGSAVARADRVEVRRIHLEFSGLARACAGGVAVDGVHDFTLTGTFYDESNVPLSGETLKFVFEGNKGHDYGDSRPLKRAKYVPNAAQGQVAVPGSNGEAMTASTDAEGKVSVQVLSSDIISDDIKIKVKWTDAQGQEKDVGGRACDFAEAVSYRRFVNPYDPDEEVDKGWLFNQLWMNEPDAETTAKVYLKFLVDPMLGDINGNWKVVNSHHMMIHVDGIGIEGGEDNAVTEVTSDLDLYAYVIPNQPDGSTIATTTGDGAATVILKAGSKIAECDKIWLSAFNQSQWDE